MQMTRYVTCLFTLSIALFFAQNVIAEDTLDSTGEDAKQFYDVEIIVFKNISVPRGRELNLPTPSPSKTEQTLDLSDPDSIQKHLQQGFSNLQQGELRLLDIVKQIIRSSRYQLLTHTGWRQPGLETAESIPVWIKGGSIFGRGYSSIDQQEPAPMEQQLQKPPLPVYNIDDTNSNINPARANGEFYELEGRIIITLSRYLHTQANLVLRKPASLQNLVERSDDVPEEDEINTIEGRRLLNYGLNEKRRMRSKKLHYLDNPQFGMLILITPYEKPEIKTVVDTTPVPVAPIAGENKAETPKVTQ